MPEVELPDPEASRVDAEPPLVRGECNGGRVWLELACAAAGDLPLPGIAREWMVGGDRASSNSRAQGSGI